MRNLFISAGFFLFCACSAPAGEVPAGHEGPAAAKTQAQTIVAGKVAETMDSGGYTYVRVTHGKDSSWVATSQQKLNAGQEVSFSGAVVMEDFFSKSLNRHFKNILFSEGQTKGAAEMPAMKGPSPHGPTPALFTIKIAKAEGPDAYTVSEAYAQGAKLAGKTVSVRGKVVKVSLDIMGLNWVHLQDGSGDAKAGTHDLVVTTKETAKVGETVTARGTLAKDKDFGYGYKYSVLLEKASFKR